jgi:hypothetical protein
MALSAQWQVRVPPGRVGILRGYRFQFDPVYINIPLEAIRLTLTVGEKAVWTPAAQVFTSRAPAVSGYESISYGQALDDLRPCYILLDQSQWVSMLFTFAEPYITATGGDGASNITLFAELTGDILLKTGRPIEQEPGGMPIVPGAPVNPSPSGATPSGGAEMLRRPFAAAGGQVLAAGRAQPGASGSTPRRYVTRGGRVR